LLAQLCKGILIFFILCSRTFAPGYRKFKHHVNRFGGAYVEIKLLIYLESGRAICRKLVFFFKLNTAVKPSFKMETSSSTLFILSVFIFLKFNYLPVNKHTLQKTSDNIPRAEHFISCFHSNHGYQHLTNNLTPSHLKYSIFITRFTFSFFAKEIKNDVTAALYQYTKQISIQ